MTIEVRLLRTCGLVALLQQAARNPNDPPVDFGGGVSNLADLIRQDIIAIKRTLPAIRSTLRLPTRARTRRNATH